MRTPRLRAVCGLWLVLGTLHCGGQSTDPGNPDGGGSFPDATPDQRTPDPDSSPAPDADDAPTGTGVWNAASTGFELTDSGGFRSRPTGSECMTASVTYTFTAPARLAVNGCSDGYLEKWEVLLGQAAASELRDALDQLRTTEQAGCGADAPDIRMTVLGAGGGQYESNFYRGCVSHTPFGKGIEFSALNRLINLLQKNKPVVPPIEPPDAGMDADADGSSDADGSVDADARDGDFVSHPVWTPNSTGFDVREWGGLPWGRTDRDECTRGDVTFYYTASSAQLSARGCDNGKNANWDIQLYSGAVSELWVWLNDLQTVPVPTICIADAPLVNMTVLGPGGGRYESDVRPSFCTGAPTFGESVSWEKLGNLLGFLRRLRDRCVDDRVDAGVDASIVNGELGRAPIWGGVSIDVTIWESGIPPIPCRVLATGNTDPVRDN